MAKRARPAAVAAVQPSKGKKIVFGDDDDLEIGLGMEDNDQVEPEDIESDGEEEDDAPEAVGMGAGRAAEEQQSKAEQSAELAKRQAAKIRLQKIQALKDAVAKSKGKARAAPQPAPPRRSKRQSASREEEDEDGADAETLRLRARMERAMDEGSGDSEEDDGSVSDHDEGEASDEVDGSFHTDSDGEGSFHTEDEDEDEGDDDGDGDDSDDSETLKEGPLTAQDIKMRALMDQAMAAADRRAGLETSVSTSKPSKVQREVRRKTTEKETMTRPRSPAPMEDETQWDMTPGFGPKPLSAAMLAAAEVADQELKARKQRQKEAARERKEAEETAQRKKRRKVKQAEEVTRRLDDGRIVQLLPPRLDQSSALPPALDPGQTGRVKNPKDKFLKFAMKHSGQRPGRGVVDGRRGVGMRTM